MNKPAKIKNLTELQELSTEKLKDNTNIIEALDKKALYKYNY